MPGKLVVSVIAVLLAAVTAAASPEGEEQWLKAWPARAQQLEAVKGTAPEKLTDEAKLEVIGWLERDARALQEHFTRTGQGAGEAVGDYYIELVLLVASLQDRRSIHALSMAMDVAGRVSTTLAEFGDEAVDPVLAQLENPFLRDSATFTLGKFVQGKTLAKCELSKANENRIRERLLRLARDPLPTVRQNAVGSLAYFALDSEILSVIRDIAEHDPYVRKRAEDHLPDHFPVREAARRALERMQPGT